MQFTVRLTDAEAEALRLMAIDEDRSIAYILHRAATRELGQRLTTPAPRKSLGEAVRDANEVLGIPTIPKRRAVYSED